MPIISENQITLSIIVPCFNEEKTLAHCLHHVLAIQDETTSLEVIVVDDCSTDNSRKIAEAISTRHPEVTVLHHDRNRGKGAALQTGFQRAAGRIIAIQDADLEYDPTDLKRMIVPIVNDQADVVLGSRFATGSAHRVLYFWHSLGNKFLTLLSKRSNLRTV